MKKKLFIYTSFVLFFLFLTPVFMAVHAGVFDGCGLDDYLLVLWHSLPQHLAVTAWIMLPAFVVGIPYVWIRGDWHRRFMIYYIPLAFVPVLLLWCIDIVLYGFWGFRLDTTPLVYILDDPITALQESPVWAPFASTVLIAFFVWLLHRIMVWVYPPRRSGSSSCMSYGRKQQHEGLCNLLLSLAMLLVALWPSMGSAYFSDRQPLNHAATNPIFSFFHSLRQQQVPLGQQYQYMSDEQMHAALNQLEQEGVPLEASVNDSVAGAQYLSGQAPSCILLVLFESFSGTACHYLYPEADPQIMPNVNLCMEEGIAFTQFYANSFRTERGLVSVLSGYPGQPTYTVMTDTLRTAQLDYLPAALREVGGYDFRFVHGGDASFTHLSEYLRYAGASSVIDRDDFPEHQQTCIWGVHDEQVFDQLATQIVATCRLPGSANQAISAVSADAPAPQQSSRSFLTLLTLSSHEPFEVPFSRFPNDPYLNSVAYTDSCFGLFIDKLKADTAVWNQLLIVGMPDHCYAQYPAGIQQSDPRRYHIPMFWIGGAVSGHHEVTTFGSQVDLAATLTSLVAPESPLAASRFPFSHNLLSPASPHYAFFSWPDGFGLLTPEGSYIQDNNYDGHPLPGSDDSDGRVELMGKAYLQQIYQDLSARGGDSSNHSR